MTRMLICAAVMIFAANSRGETHRFTPTQFHNTFSYAHAPVQRIKPGDRVITQTIDARGFDHQNRKVGEGPNPETGPFFVEGAERATCWS